MKYIYLSPKCQDDALKWKCSSFLNEKFITKNQSTWRILFHEEMKYIGNLQVIKNLKALNFLMKMKIEEQMTVSNFAHKSAARRGEVKDNQYSIFHQTIDCRWFSLSWNLLKWMLKHCTCISFSSLFILNGIVEMIYAIKRRWGMLQAPCSSSTYRLHENWKL